MLALLYHAVSSAHPIRTQRVYPLGCVWGARAAFPQPSALSIAPHRAPKGYVPFGARMDRAV